MDVLTIITPINGIVQVSFENWQQDRFTLVFFFNFTIAGKIKINFYYKFEKTMLSIVAPYLF